MTYVLSERDILNKSEVVYRLSSMGSNGPQLTTQTLKVLGTFLNPPNVELSGADIARDTKIFSGTLYPILMRLEDAKWLESRWEASDAREGGGPRRRLYRMTALGAKRTKIAFLEFEPIVRRLAWT